MDFQFFDCKKIVFFRILKINHSCLLGFSLSVRFLHCYRDTVTNQKIFLLIYLQQRRSGQSLFQYLLCFGNLAVIYPRIKFFQSFLKITKKENFIVACPSKCPIFSQCFCVIGKLYIPSQFITEQIAGTFLY